MLGSSGEDAGSASGAYIHASAARSARQFRSIVSWHDA
jgi:hypothetical protein